MQKRATVLAAVAAASIIVTGCSGTSTTPPASAPASGGGGGSAFDPTKLDSAFTQMASLTSVYTAGKGLVGVILPDATTSARYTAYDLPYLTTAFEQAGYAAPTSRSTTPQGTTTTELAIAQADITAGAKVLLVDPLDGTTGKADPGRGSAAGIAMISYDRATFQGTNTYYVSFDNVQVGKLIGQGFMQCVTAWAVTSPKVFTARRRPGHRPERDRLRQGLQLGGLGPEVAQVKAGATNSAGMTLVGEQLAPGWDNSQGGTIFQQAFTAQPDDQRHGRGQ